ncbi:hypothetical protein [Leptolyngbya sp. FACHB-16]|uniref:hypothetical protein n=1 Tax=unclassified Leptolyngbya TaxID=2650499 RepID=UPI001A7E5066
MVVTKNRREFYIQQRARKEEELAAIESQLEGTLSSVHEIKLNREAENILKKIEELDEKLRELDAGCNSSANVRELNIERTFSKIDFHRARKIASNLHYNLKNDGGAVLFFIQKSKKQMGHYCVDEVLNIIMGDQVIDGQIYGDYRRFSIDLGSAISEYNEVELLTRLASYFNLEPVADLSQLTEALRREICASLSVGCTLFFEIRSLDDLIERESFLRWFLKEFWQPLVSTLDALKSKYRSKVIVAVMADSQILSDCPMAYFCDEQDFDPGKFLELPVPDWTMQDIRDWLIRFGSVFDRTRSLTEQDIEQIARRIHRDSEGTPESVCLRLRERFL